MFAPGLKFLNVTKLKEGGGGINHAKHILCLANNLLCALKGRNVDN